jgi:FADH2 O2-dependent halogenase
LLVAASPNNEVSDTHWLRADVDHFLVKEAIALGAEYVDEAQMTGMERRGDTMLLTGERRGQPHSFRAHVVVDATGPRGFLSRTLNLPETSFSHYPPTQTLFSHFTDVHRCDRMAAFQTDETPPYAPDDAALHHVFDGGWMWVLRFNNGVTSAGFAVTDELAEELRIVEKEAAWKRFLSRFPTVREQFADAQPIQPFFTSSRLSYRCGMAAGDGWVLLPSAAAFIDPLFSTGMPLTLLGIERLGRILSEAWETAALSERLRQYAAVTLAEADGVAELVGGCYAAFSRFPLFAAFSMFYFAAASFSEMARRLEKRHLATRFLLANDLDFSAHLRRSADQLRSQSDTLDPTRFAEQIARAIAPRNVAGLAAPDKRNWYGVDLEDLVHTADKLDMTPDTMSELLRTAPWAIA